MGAVLTVSMKIKTRLAGGRCPQARKKKREEKQRKGVVGVGGDKRLYLSRAELSSSSRWASDVLPSLDRASILFIMTSSMSLIFLRTPRDSTPPSTGKDGEGEALGFTAERQRGGRMHPTEPIYQEGAMRLQLSHGQNNMRMNVQIQSAGKS